MKCAYLYCVAALLAIAALVRGAEPRPLPGTAPLVIEGDIASRLVDAADAFLLREIDKSVERRARHWQRDTSSADAYNRSIEPNRRRLARYLGVRDPRVEFAALSLIATTRQPALVGRGEGYDIFAVRWPAIAGVEGEGLLLVPTGRDPLADVICLPDCEQTPEMLVGLADGVPPESQFARRLAESGCRVIVPVLIDRGTQLSVGMGGARPTKITHREFLYRPAFEMGRHLIGYELQKVLVLVDWHVRERGASDRKLGVVGYGEGGMLALYAGGLDQRIDVVGVSGYFDSRQRIWDEPLDRNVFGQLDEFGDAEIAAMIAPRPLIVEACAVPKVAIVPGNEGGPGETATPAVERVRTEAEQARKVATFEPAGPLELVESNSGRGPFGTDEFLQAMLGHLRDQAKLAPAASLPKNLRAEYDPAPRLKRQFDQILEHTQRLIVESRYTREKFMSAVDRSGDLEKYNARIKPYRDYFRDEIIGSFDYELLDANPRSRQVYDTPAFTGYEVVLDVYPGLFAYGILLVPKGIEPGERRPVVVCQHGLEGRPRDTIEADGPGYRAYKAFAARLAERGFITFAPQNLYIFRDRFRTLQRKANTIKKTLFSIMVPQHQQIVAWLASRPEVDAERIAFYGLSYGGKSAMRIPPLVDGYCLSICSADFNEWVWKNASVRSAYSYAYRGEYEIFEFDLGSTFNYSEMAHLICPRPFMVERGHRDGVAPDEMVAFEYAKVRLLYADLKIPERTEIEYFDGPHTINGEGTFDFLHKHLDWPQPVRKTEP